MTMTLISTVTVGAGGAANINFTSIPQTYTDLMIQLSGRDGRASSGGFVYLRFNGSSSTYNTSQWAYANGGSVTVDYYGTGDRISFSFLNNGDSSTSTTFGNAEIYVPNYTSTTTNKTVAATGCTENNSTNNAMVIAVGNWNSTSAITQITLYPTDTTNFAQYSSASLYGILKGSGGATVS